MNDMGGFINENDNARQLNNNGSNPDGMEFSSLQGEKQDENKKPMDEFEKHNDKDALRDLAVHPRHANITFPVVKNTPNFKDLHGEWLYWDSSREIQEWLIRNIVVSDDGTEFLAYDTPPDKRSPAKGYIYNGQVYMYFSEERGKDNKLISEAVHRPVKLIDKDTLQFIGDLKFTEWIRKGSERDPLIKFDKTLRTAKFSRDILAAVKATLYPEQHLIGEAQFRSVAKAWIQWIAWNDPEKTKAIDEAADIMRQVARLVRYLALQLGQEVQLDLDYMPEETKNRLQLNNARVGTTDGSSEDNKSATLRVHRRIAGLFAEMSNIRNFTNNLTLDKKTFEAVKEELLTHVVPILIPRLSMEEDLETRRCFAAVLANLRLNHTVDALVDALVSDQQVRANRQKMIADYYLQPSKQQSDDAADILKGAVKSAKRTLVLLQAMNVFIFLAGLLILVGGLYMSFTNPSARIEGALVGLGGFAGVIALLVNEPLNRIQNSLSNLVQLESAFTSFIWELNLNSTYIQSQYVADGLLSENDVANTLSRIEDAMEFTMTQVATYTDEGREVIVPHLTFVSSSAGKNGAMSVQLYGNHLKVGAKKKDVEDKFVVAVNHVPFKTIQPPQKKNMISFDIQKTDLPRGFNASNKEIWISLIINGYETNALSLKPSTVNQQFEPVVETVTSQAGSVAVVTNKPSDNQQPEPKTETTPAAIPS